MIYTLTVDCLSGLHLKEKCRRVIEISEDASLLDLHYCIQDAVGFDRDHLFEFYAGRNPRNRAVRFADPADLGDDFEGPGRILLKEIWPLDRMRLYYLFDFGDEWVFGIRKPRKVKPPEEGVSYPRLVEAIGPDPEQYGDEDEEGC
jgi:hypothetical protein